MGSIRVEWRFAATVAAVVAGMLAAPAAASAMTCDKSAALLTITLEGGGENAQLEVVAGEITLENGVVPVSCGAVTPTVTNIGAISIIGGAFHTVVIHNADAFAPGAVPQDGSDDPTGSDEIEIFVNLNDENSSSLIVDTGDDGDAFVFGSGGVNTNVLGEAAPADADIMGIGTAGSLAGFGGNASDSLNAGGGLGTGSALSERIILDGRGGADSVVGGGGDDSITGGDGTSLTLDGEGGNDSINPGPQDDIDIDGGAGTDRVVYGNGTAPGTGVTVDLSLTGPQNTGGSGTDTLTNVEDLHGTDFNDVLRGDAGANRLVGRLGADLLDGRLGSDVLEGDENADTIEARDGVPDIVSCGTQIDSASVDLAGVDTVNADCETVFFPSPADAGGGDGGGGGAGEEVPSPADTELSFDLSGKGRQRLLKQKGVVVSASCPLEACTATASGKKLKPETAAVDAGVAEKLELELKRKKLRAIAVALRKGKKPKLTVSASVSDAAGNQATDKVKVRARP